MKQSLHLVLIAALTCCLHLAGLNGQDNSFWLRNLSEGMGAETTNLDDRYPEIAAAGDNVHAIWFTLDATSQLYYRRSSTNGESWDPKMQLLEGDLDINKTYNRMVVSGNYVHIVTSWYNGTEDELAYFRSTDGGATFEPKQVLFSTSAQNVRNVHIFAQNQKVCISFTHECSYCGFQKKLFLLHSDDNGSSFETKQILENPSGNFTHFDDLRIASNNVYLLYMESIGFWANYDYKLHLLSSIDGGNTFADHVLSEPAESGEHHAFLLQNETNGYNPKIAADGDKVWVIWSGWDENNVPAVFVRHSADAGVNFQPISKISGSVTDIYEGLETIVAKGNDVYTVFNTNGGKLYVSHSDDGGVSFSSTEEFSQPDAKYLSAGIEPQLSINPADNGAFVLATGPLLGKISKQGSILGPSFYGSYSFGVSRRPKMALSDNGFLHLLMEGGHELLQTGVFDDDQIWYRRINLNQTEVGQGNNALHMEILPNPGDGSGLARYDNMIISPELSDNFTDAFTVELWIKPEGGPPYEKKILTQYDNNTWNINNPESFQLWATEANQPVAGLFTSTGAYAIWGDKNLLPGFWNHLAVVYANDGNPDNFKLFLNGQVIASATATGNIAPSDAMWFLGSVDDGNGYGGPAGDYDELQFWNVARTEAQIRQDKFTSFDGSEEGLTAYFQFNKISPFGEVTDLTGHGFTGHMMYKEGTQPSSIEDMGLHFSYTQTVSTFAFTQESNGAESFQWDFGNGETSELVNPAFTYDLPGIFNVCLTAFGGEMYDTFCEEVEVEGIEKIFPTEGGNTDYVTLYIYGGGFNANNVVKLRRSGFGDILAEQTIYDEKKTLTALLNLDGQETGLWDIVIDNGGQEMVLPEAFSIVPGEVSKPYVLYNGGGRILTNRWTPQTITLGNSANVDAHGVLLWVTLPDDPGNDIAFVNLNVKPPQSAIDNGWVSQLEAIGDYVVVDSLFGKPNHSRVYTFYFPIIPAKSSFDIALRVKVGQLGGSVPVNVWLNEPFYHSPLSVEVQACVALSAAKALLKAGVAFVPGVACISSFLSIESSYLDDQPPTPSSFENIDTRSWAWILGTNILECASSLAGGSVLNGIITIITSSVEAKQENDDCYNGFQQVGWLDILYYGVASFDPNEKLGMQGFTEEGYIGKQSRMGYQIRFENKSTATAPANEVVIIDTLTFDKIDLSNFSFGIFGWGDTILTPLPNSKEFGMDVDMRPERDLIVRVSGTLDEIQKIVTWRFSSLDPTTMDYVSDPFNGFLPPNLDSPEGEGFVTFTTGISEDILNEEVIENRASIIFDGNSPILTNLYKNTFDLALPESELNSSFTTTTDTLINLVVSASDGESQVREVEIWVSENDSAYVFSQVVHGDEVAFTGQYGSSYRFYSIAIDSVGNREAAPSVPDAEISILVATDEVFSTEGIRVYPIPAQNQIMLEFGLKKVASLEINLQDVTGRKVKTLFEGNLSAGQQKMYLNLSVPPGMYFLLIGDGVHVKPEKIVVIE